MGKVYELDILQKEKDENLPYWLDPSQKQQQSEALKRIREKYRLKREAERKAKAKKK